MLAVMKTSDTKKIEFKPSIALEVLPCTRPDPSMTDDDWDITDPSPITIVKSSPSGIDDYYTVSWYYNRKACWYRVTSLLHKTHHFLNGEPSLKDAERIYRFSYTVKCGYEFLSTVYLSILSHSLWSLDEELKSLRIGVDILESHYNKMVQQKRVIKHMLKNFRFSYSGLKYQKTMLNSVMLVFLGIPSEVLNDSFNKKMECLYHDLKFLVPMLHGGLKSF